VSGRGCRAVTHSVDVRASRFSIRLAITRHLSLLVQ